MSNRSFLLVGVACAAFAWAAPAAAQSGSPAAVTVTTPVQSPSMQSLQDATQRLREAIQAMARQPAGPQRDHAIAKAKEALLETQGAMLALPPQMRSSDSYDESVSKLMMAADQLREAVQELAQRPPGVRRNQAIAQANRALWDTQVAMGSAHASSLRGTSAMGAGARR